MNNKGKIKSVTRNQGVKRYVQGSSFTKGEYMSEDAPTFLVRVFGEKAFEVGREIILSLFPDRKRVTDSLLDKLKNMDADKLRGK